MIHADIVRPDALTSTDTAVWRSLAHGPFASPLLQPEFANLVAQVRDDVRVSIFRKGQNRPGFLAFHKRPGRLARSLAAPFSDIQALVSAPEFAATGPEALKAAGIRAFQFDALRDPFGIFCQTPGEDSEAHVIAPGPDIDHFLEQQRALHAKRFKNHRRLARQMERECGALSFTAPDSDSDALAQLLDWKRTQFKNTGRHDVLAADWVQSLMQLAHNTTTGAVRGLFVSLRVNGNMVAGLFGVRSESVFNPWIAAYDSAYAAWSPGQQVLHELIAAMPSLGLESCDIGADHDHYKKYYAANAVPVKSALVTAPGLDLGITRARALFWSAAERTPAAPLAMKIRRRLNQISAVELDTGQRVSGFVRAVTQKAQQTVEP